MNVMWLPGRADYDETLKLQEKLVVEHQLHADRDADLLLLEHQPVYTIGRTRDQSSLGPSHGCNLPYPVREIHRGGQATYHGPGQLVGYPIVNLDHFHRDLHHYIESLERAVIAVCKCWGIQAEMKEGLVGVWVEDRKIASIGVGVKKWVSMHGFALNILPECLPPFRYITPCGIQGVQMTCLYNELSGEAKTNVSPDWLHEVGVCFAKIWRQIYELQHTL